jgi:hypothetical protein
VCAGGGMSEMPTSRGRRRNGALAGTTLFLLACQIYVASAQSLGDVASRSVGRQPSVTQGRVYTNADLVPDASVAPAPSVVAAEPGTSTPMRPFTPAAEAATAPPALTSVIVNAPEKNNAPYWRAKAQKFTRRLARTTTGVTTAKARLDQIDAAPQTASSMRERDVVAATLSRLQREARALDSELASMMTKVEPSDVSTE